MDLNNIKRNNMETTITIFIGIVLGLLGIMLIIGLIGMVMSLFGALKETFRNLRK